MADILEFKPRKNKESKVVPSTHIFSLHMFEDKDGAYEVDMEISNEHTDGEVLEALIAAMHKFAIDHDLMEDEIELELE